MSDPGDFVRWATDPARSGDELFTVELLIERMRVSLQWPFREREAGFEERMRRMKERKFTPGYRPELPRDEIEALAERAGTVTHFGGSGLSDRPLRDLKALSFFPALEDLGLSGCDTSDFTPLAALWKVKRMTIGEFCDPDRAHELSFAGLGEMPALEHAHISLRQPWPDLRAMAHWPALRELIFNGNVLALAEVETLPALESLKAHNWGDISTPLRDLLSFPALPQVKRLDVALTTSLKGIERYGTVVNLELGGRFSDLAPLAGLENVTFLQLTSEHFSDLRPLLQMPKLRELVLVRERPLDLSLLTDAPHLRRVDFERCAIMRMELAALNAGLPPEANDFMADPPRSPGPLKFYFVGKDDKAGQKHFGQRARGMSEMRESFYAGDAALERSEARTFLGALHAALNGLLGHGWGLVDFRGATKAGGTFLTIKRYQDTTRIREIVQLLRESSACSRLPWYFTVMVAPHGDMSYELEELQELEAKAREPEGHWLAEYCTPEAALEQSEEEARRYREKYELLEREHLFELQKQQGAEVELPPLSDEEEDDDEEEGEPLGLAAADEDDADGGVAIAPPPPAPPDTEELSDQLRYALDVYEDCMLVSHGWVDRARYGLGEAPVEWTGDEG